MVKTDSMERKDSESCTSCLRDWITGDEPQRIGDADVMAAMDGPYRNFHRVPRTRQHRAQGVATSRGKPSRERGQSGEFLQCLLFRSADLWRDLSDQRTP